MSSNLDLLLERLAVAVDDPEAFFAIIDPDVVWDLSGSESPEAGVYEGRDAVRDLYRRWVGAFSDWSFDIERTIESGDDVILVVRERGHGRTSGIGVEMLRANVWTFRDANVVRFRSFSNARDAFEAAGLDPDTAEEA